MKPVPHGEPYAGKLHVRFDEGYPPKNGEARFEGSRRPSGRTLRGRLALLYTLMVGFGWWGCPAKIAEDWACGCSERSSNGRSSLA